MESRIKELRENRGLIQDILASELGITQQTLSKYERDVTCIKVDVLKKIAEYFNVTTDYLLCVSEVKRDLQGQIEYSCAMKSHFRKFGNQMSGSGNHLCEFTRVVFYLSHTPPAWTCHAQHQYL